MTNFPVATVAVIITTLRHLAVIFFTLKHQLNDLRMAEPIAQMLLYLTLTTNHRLITAIKQNHSTRRRGYPVLIG